MLGLALLAISAVTMRWAQRRWWRMNESRNWPSVEGRLIRRHLPGAGFFNAWRRMGFHARLCVQYEVDGKSLSCRRLSFGFPSQCDLRSVPTPLFPGEKVTLFHDPEHPGRAVFITGPVGERILSTVFLTAAGGLALSAVLLALGALG